MAEVPHIVPDLQQRAAMRKQVAMALTETRLSVATQVAASMMRGFATQMIETSGEEWKAGEEVALPTGMVAHASLHLATILLEESGWLEAHGIKVAEPK